MRIILCSSWWMNRICKTRFRFYGLTFFCVLNHTLVRSLYNGSVSAAVNRSSGMTECLPQNVTTNEPYVLCCTGFVMQSLGSHAGSFVAWNSLQWLPATVKPTHFSLSTNRLIKPRECLQPFRSESVIVQSSSEIIMILTCKTKNLPVAIMDVKLDLSH
jgi:hypothetical protein